MPGSPWPPGADFDGAGVNFALFSAHAEKVELCLFDATGATEVARHALPACSNSVWHGWLPDARPGLVYGYRVHGLHAPEQGQRFNPAKLLLDPYARAVIGEFRDDPRHADSDSRDNADVALKARVIDEPFDWQGDVNPRTPWSQTFICEAHVKGLTRRHPAVPLELRGSYAGIAHPAVIDHLQKLGITALQLLPVQFFLDEPRLSRNGLTNYWGYNPLAWFAPTPRYWSGRPGTTPLSEFRDMVRALHSAGIEVILDVVFNHSAELDSHGPTLSLRGIDNASYYLLAPHRPAEYENHTGCGNTLNLAHPRVVQLAMDCLRYWATECHVDGFRFDLASVLGRNQGRFDAAAPLLVAIGQDPVLAGCKLIAEPWDIGHGGYQLGRFPPGWAEWNDQYRDTLRQFWLTEGVSRAAFARRFAASSDLFRHDGRGPEASLNFITAHDGFTLADLVSYNHKHNQANLEHNRDGHNHNHGWNCGEEGPTSDPHVNLLRLRVRKALLATLLLAQGTPMLLAGDELGHSQQGNNNAYCQDNEMTWLNWAEADPDLSDYVSRLLTIRRQIPALASGRWWRGQPDDTGAKDVEWLNPSGTHLEAHDWDDPAGKALMIRLSGNWLLLVNASAHQVVFRLPRGDWTLCLSSADEGVLSGEKYTVAARSVTILQTK
ncbi:glycogen debranching protein GlgX [Formivibrio citricus]|uniref:glycogen debranching protein GlgX n=1 Tax=Formivibrio citricus TaxID=83765 RepID=UPI000B88022E|nr:glycogen debranching protein GlgX [Formivibrio citricus]